MCPACIRSLVSTDGLLADTSPSETGEAALEGATAPATPEAPASTRAAQGIPCRDPDCEHAGRVPRAGCTTCGRQIRVRFPWGDTAIEAGASLVVGRAEEPLAANLAEYRNVSRRHAEIRNNDGHLVVMDLNSANGTFVNDELISSGREVSLHGRDKVRFAADLSAEIDVSETQ
jgi:hypothetical protein